MSSTRKWTVAAAALIVAVVASGCGSVAPGAAAVVGDERISERELTEHVQAVLRAQGRPVDSSAESIVDTTLNQLVTASLVEQYSEQEGIEVDQGEIDAAVVSVVAASGGQEALEQSLLQQDLAPDQLEALLRVNLLVQKIGQALDPAGTPESQSSAVFSAIVAFSEEVGTRINPRYGTWDAMNLGVGPAADDLSAPLAAS